MFVVDASIAVAWCIEDEATPFTNSLRDRALRSGADAPGHWLAEVANALIMAERRGRLTRAETVARLSIVDRIPVRLDRDNSRGKIFEIVRIAAEYDLTAYDAAYLECAKRLNQPLATLDQRLRAAAIRSGDDLILS